jgi:hypothetical protein
MEQREDFGSFEFFSAIQEIQFHDKAKPGDIGP